jgi:hypothetical protein
MKLLAVLVLASSLAACGTRSDEEQVRELIATLEKAAEARDASDLLEHVADDYADDDGNDKAQLGNWLRGYFLLNPTVDAQVDVESLERPVDGLVQSQIDITVLPAGNHTTLAVEFRRRDGDWQVVRADRVRDHP